MKKLLLILSFLCMATFCRSQTEQFKKGQFDAQLGVGFINTANINTRAAGLDEVSKFRFVFPPPIISVEYGVTDEISLGGFFSYMSSKHTFYGYEDPTEKVFFIGTRGLYHVDVHPKLDTYGGGSLSIGSSSRVFPGVWEGDPMVRVTKSDLYFQLILGSRYRFTQNTGAFLELSYGLTLINIGINVKL